MRDERLRVIFTCCHPALATGADRELVRLAEQDRARWNKALIAEGQAIVRKCLSRNQPGPYQIQAAINAVHSDAGDASATDWRQILQLYDQLQDVAPSPVVALNRAVAVAEVEGPAVALALVDALPLRHYHLFHAIRADLLNGWVAMAMRRWPTRPPSPAAERERARFPAAAGQAAEGEVAQLSTETRTRGRSTENTQP